MSLLTSVREKTKVMQTLSCGIFPERLNVTMRNTQSGL